MVGNGRHRPHQWASYYLLDSATFADDDVTCNCKENGPLWM